MGSGRNPPAPRLERKPRKGVQSMKQNSLRRLGALVLSLAMALTMAVTPAMALDLTVTIKGVSPATLPATLSVGDSATIEAELALPDPAATYQWSQSGDGTVRFSSDATATTTIEAVTAGSVTITVTATSGGTDTGSTTHTLTVTNPAPVNVPVTGVTVTPSTLSMTMGGGVQTLTASVEPANATNKTVTWGSTNEKVATVNKDTGLVTAKGVGSTTITATAKDGSGVSGSCTVTVSAQGVTKISFPNPVITLTAAANPTVTLDTQPYGSKVSAVEWISGDETVVTVEPSAAYPGTATLKAQGPGETTITAKAGDSDDLKAVCTVKVSGIVIEYNGEKADAATPITLTKNVPATLVVRPYGDADTHDVAVWESDNNAVVYVVSGGKVSPRAVGNAHVTVRKGKYIASCTINVVEDTSTLITTSSINAGAEISMNHSSIRSRLNAIAYSKGYGSVDYVTNLTVGTDQGILYYGYLYEGDTGAGVGMEKYYLNPKTNAGQLALSELGFVARTTFSGSAEIHYTAYCGSNSFSGLIRVPVNAVNDVVYSTTRDRPITFQAGDFNAACRTKNGRDLKNVTFTLPQASSGTLYYDYLTLGENAQQVTAGTAYGRLSAPYLDSVTFVPAQNCPSVVTIGYQGYDVSNRAVSGRVTINITGGGGTGSDVVRNTDVRYTGNWGDQIIFRASDFTAASLASIGEQLSYVRFYLPASSQGTLYFNYNSSGSYSSYVSPATNYYPSSAPAIGGVSFVPASTANSRVTMSYTGYGVRGNTFSGTIYIDYGDPSNPTVRYSTYSGKLVNFQASDFNNACLAATGSTLDYVQFTGLPGNAQGVMYYDYRSSNSYNTQVSSWNSYYRSTSNSYQNQLGRISFLAGKEYTGTVRIPYTGYSTDRNRTSFTGTVVIQVSTPAPNDINLSTTAASPVKLSSSTVRSVCYAVMDQELSYIQITSLPPAAAGQLYSNYSGGGTGTAVNVGARFYRSGTPGIDQLSFVPRGGYQGTATIGYTGVGVNGQQVSGRINVTVGRSGTSGYFNDMGNYAWAADAVDYLYRSGVVNGMGNGGYGPSLPIRRCDFVVMLCRAFRLNGGGGYSFADVPVNSYYGQALATAKSLGIVSGDGANFYPNNNLSRQDAMVMIYNTLQATGHNLTNGLTADLSIFLDQAQISPYARNSVGILVYLGAVKGDGNGYLRPRSTINRAEAAILIQFIMAM